MPSEVFLHPWEWVTIFCQRIHIDFASSYQGLVFLVVVDAHSKWPEVTLWNNATLSAKTIKTLRNLLARFGVPIRFLVTIISNLSQRNLSCLQSPMSLDILHLHRII